MIEKVKIYCFADAELYFKNQPKETYLEFIQDLEACITFDWPTFCQRINSLQKSYLSEIEFVH